MKKYLYIILLAFIAIPLTGCNKSDEGKPSPVYLEFFAFGQDSLYVNEGQEIEVVVFWSKNSPKAGTLELTTSYMGYKYKAEEGKDYTLSTKELVFGENEYEKTFTIKTTSDPEWSEHKRFRVEFKTTNTNSLLGEPGKDISHVVVTIENTNPQP